METGAIPGCRGMARYRDMLEWKDVCYFSINTRKVHGEKERLAVKNQKLCIAIYREALKREDCIGPQEFRLLGRYARAVGEPRKVVGMIGTLAAVAYEKRHGCADVSLRVGIETELLRPAA